MKLRQKGTAETEHAMRYVDQLTRHWGHRFDVRQQADGAWFVDFKDDTGVMLASRGEIIEMTITGGEADLGMLRQVTEEHVDRFAHREGHLVYRWDMPFGED